MHITIEDQEEFSVFELTEEALPNSEMNIESPSFGKYSNSIVNINIKSQYFFGKQINGVVDIDIKKMSHCGSNLNETITYSQKDLPISATLEEKIDFKDVDINFNPTCDNEYGMEFTMRDLLTNETIKMDKSITFVKQNVIIRFVNNNEKIKPGLNFRCIIEVSMLDDENFNFDSGIQGFKINTILNDQTIHEAFSMDKKRNQLTLNYNTETNTKKLNVSVLHNDEIISWHSYTALETCIKTLLSIDFQELIPDLKVGKIFNIILTSNVNIDMIKYYFVRDQQIFNASTHVFLTPQKMQIMEIYLDINLGPKSKLVVFFHDKTTNSLAEDYIDIEVHNFFSNNMKLNMISLDYMNNETKINITADKDSNVLIHAYSSRGNNKKSNILLSQFNNLIKRKLSNYDNQSPLKSDVQFATDIALSCPNPYSLDSFVVEKNNDNFYSKTFFDSTQRQTWIFDKYDR